jgi:hypothetical protein
MSQRWKKITLGAGDLPLVVVWSEMLAATGIPESRAWQLVQEGTFPIRHLPYHGYSPRGRKRYMGRSQIDPRGYTFWNVEILKFIALDEDERHRQTLLEWERPRCCHCPFHCPPQGQVQQEHPYAARFKRWWNQWTSTS